jgi:hypothetical protein
MSDGQLGRETPMRRGYLNKEMKKARILAKQICGERNIYSD